MKRVGILSLFLLTTSLMSGESQAEQNKPSLSLPIDCILNETCFIQQYVDGDPGSGSKDYTCGSATYNGHKGTDFRVRSLADVERGTDVLASASGTVVAVRNKQKDYLLKTKKDKAAVKGRECGNGVVIQHDGDWRTQYCHMKQGSVVVQKGDRVVSGQKLGQVGYSGAAAFPHVHLKVQHKGAVIDPFTAKPPDGSCSSTEATSLWRQDVAPSLAYMPRQLLALDFATSPVKLDDLLMSGPSKFIPAPTMPALVLYMWAINLEKGDIITVILDGPDGQISKRQLKPLTRHKAQRLTFAGRKRRGATWPSGIYTGKLSVSNAGKPVLNRSVSFELRP